MSRIPNSPWPWIELEEQWEREQRVRELERWEFKHKQQPQELSQERLQELEREW